MLAKDARDDLGCGLILEDATRPARRQPEHLRREPQRRLRDAISQHHAMCEPGDDAGDDALLATHR